MRGILVHSFMDILLRSIRSIESAIPNRLSVRRECISWAFGCQIGGATVGVLLSRPFYNHCEETAISFLIRQGFNSWHHAMYNCREGMAKTQYSD